MSYYDVDAILTEAEKVPCKFELDIPDLGHLDNNPTQPLKAGTTLSLPLWLAEMLAISSAGEDAKPPPTPLRRPPRPERPLYGLGTRMLDLFEDKDLASVLRKTFVARAAEVGLHASKVGDDMPVAASGEEFLRGLDEWERGLFRKAHEGVKGTKEWMENVKKG
ncbi:unnamed protein product [Parascedosporium putredinis]|uniref:DNA replication complex GINS protein PSF3 n=1 Tax=Parascedosporium putredinis TaxID=1442378 RepID=A0A9P1HDC7_9PEZI|nr:unnamed protein product [Parascedosporium putredinis]CAI8004173.1 unnamed protein product [Parascedosporium putredinis]